MSDDPGVIVPEADAASGEASAEVTSKDEGVTAETVKPVDTPDKSTPNFKATKHRVKTGDEELEIDYDDLIAGYQKAQVSDKKFREAAEIRKKVDGLLATLKDGGHQDLVKILGKDKARQLATDLLTEELEYQELPEHEKTIRQLEAEKKAAEEKLQEQENARQTAERKALEDKYASEIETEMVSAIKEQDFVPTPRLIARMAEVMEANFRSSGERLPASKALEYVRGDVVNEFTSFIGSLPQEKFLEVKKSLPKKFLDAIRQDDVEAVLSQDPMRSGRTVAKNLSAKKKSSNRRMTTDAWFEKMEQTLGG